MDNLPLPHAVVATRTFEIQAKRAGVSEDEMMEICHAIAKDPQGGDLIPRTGGARKLRHRSEHGVQSGGYRTIHYWGGDNVPVFLLAIYDKTQKGNLTEAEKNELRKILPKLADAYRDSAKEATGRGRHNG